MSDDQPGAQDDDAQPSSPDRVSTGRASVLMAAGTLLSRATGIVREVAVISAIGTAVFADTYSVGNSMPNVVYVLIVGGSLDAVFVPQIVRRMKFSGAAAAK